MKKKNNTAMSPREIMEISNAYRISAILFAGYRLCIFDYLEGKLVSSKKVAADLGLNIRGSDILLNALAALGLLCKKGEKFSNSPQTSIYLVTTSPQFLGALVKHNMNAWERWKKLHRVVISGEPAKGVKQENYLRVNRKKSREFILAMEAASLDTAHTLAGMLNLKNVKRILDVGGGPGTHTFEIVKRKPDIKAVILDLPLPLETTKKLVQKYGMEKNVTLQAGDFLIADYGKDFDLVIFSNVLHSNNPTECALMLFNAYEALNRQGQIVIKEYTLNDDGISPLQSALFSVNMLLNTKGGSSYKTSEIKTWLKQTGFSSISIEKLGKYTILFGKKEV